MQYNSYTIATNTELAYDPDELSNWKIFWQGAFSWYNNLHWGWKVGIGAGLFLIGHDFGGGTNVVNIIPDGSTQKFIDRFPNALSYGVKIIEKSKYLEDKNIV